MQEAWGRAEHPQYGQLQEVQLRWYSKKGLRREERSAQPAEWKLAAAKIAKLEKSNKKLKRANKKRTHDHDSDSNDSDSS